MTKGFDSVCIYCWGKMQKIKWNNGLQIFISELWHERKWGVLKSPAKLNTKIKFNLDKNHRTILSWRMTNETRMQLTQIHISTSFSVEFTVDFRLKCYFFLSTKGQSCQNKHTLENLSWNAPCCTTQLSNFCVLSPGCISQI